MQTFKPTQQPLTTNIVKWGSIGGIILIITSLVFSKGVFEILPYPFILIAALASVRINSNADGIFKKLFRTCFFTFLLMTLMVYLWILLVEDHHQDLTFTGHLLRLSFVVIMAVLSSFVLAVIVKYFK